MTSIKCPQCGLVYWTTNENCRRCGLATAGGPAEPQPDQTQSYAPAPAAQPIRSNNFEEEQLLHNLKRDSNLFYFIGGLQIVLWLFVGNLLIVDGIFNIGLSFVAHKFKSRVAAILLMLLTLLSVLAGLAAFATGALHFNLFAPVILIGRLVVSIRMVYTTFRLNAQVQVHVTGMMPPPPPVFHNEDGPQWVQPVGSAQLQPE